MTPVNEVGGDFDYAQAHVNNVEVRVINVEPQGNNAEAQGKNAEAQGNNVEPQGNNVEVRGIDVEMQGNNVEDQGINVEAQDNNLEAQVDDVEVIVEVPEAQDDHASWNEMWRNDQLRTKNWHSRKQITLALKIIGALHREERNDWWSCFTAWMTVGIMFVGAVSMVLSFAFNGLVNPWIDIPCAIFTVTDATLLICYDVLELHKQRFSPKGLVRFERWQYYFDSLVAELLLYRVTICSVISISTQRAWTPDYSDTSTVKLDDSLGILDIILASIDVITLFHIYGHRVRQIYWLMKDLHNHFNIKGRLPITYRIVFFIASNAVLFIFMTTHLFIQIYNDNLPEGDQPCKVQADNKYMAYNLISDNVINSNSFSNNRSTNLTMEDDNEICMPFLTSMMVLVTISLPVMNLFTFLCVNYPSFLHLLIDLNYFVTFGDGKDDYEQKIKKSGQNGEMLWKSVVKMKKETMRQCKAANNLNELQRLLSVTREWWIDAIVMLWAGLLTGYVMLFYRYYIKYVEVMNWSEANTPQGAYAILYIFVFTLSIALIISANYTGLLVAVAAPFMILPALVADLSKAMKVDFGVQKEIDVLDHETQAEVSRLDHKTQTIYPSLPTLTWNGENSRTDRNGQTASKVIIVSGSCTTCGKESNPLRLGIEARIEQESVQPERDYLMAAEPNAMSSVGVHGKNIVYLLIRQE